MNDKTRYIRERFPDENHTIDLLMAKDPEFVAICEDYDDCIKALRHWEQSQEPEDEARVNEYHSLIQELEEEIVEALVAANPRRLD